MKQSEKKDLTEKCAHKVIQQERVICIVAADLLIMNKLLEEDKEKSKEMSQQSSLRILLQDFKSKFKSILR